MPDAQDILSQPHPDQIQPTPNLNIGSLLEAQTYFKSPYYHDSYYFPFNPDPLCRGNNYKIYDEMRDDDQVKVALSFKKDIVVNAGWQINCVRQDIKEYVSTSLKRMQEDGSLQMSFEDAVRDMLSAYDYGFSVTEPVFKIKDGLYAYDSIRVRPAQSFRFQLSDQGDVTEIIQMSNRGELHFNPRLMMHHVYQTEWGNPYGKSDLRGAHNNWRAKKFVTKFMAIYLERFATPTVLGRYPANWDTDEIAQLMSTLKTIQNATTLTLQESAMVEFVTANKDSSDMYIKALDYYNMHIARALLVPDLLGISGEKTRGGSFALGQDQFKMFLATVEKDRLSLARKITLRLINPLVTANFGPNIKCDFEFVNYSMDDQTELLKIWADVVKGNVFKPTPEEINYLRRQVKFPEGPVVLGDPKPTPNEPGPQNPNLPSGQHLVPVAEHKVYKQAKRKIIRQENFAGLPIHVEIDRGDQKSGVDQNGEGWSHIYQYPYGEIARTEGEDGDPVDCYLGPNPRSKNVYVVHQMKQDGSHDEDKVMLGFDTPRQAEQAYRDHGPAWGFGTMDKMTLDHFKNGYLASNRKFAEKKTRPYTSAEKKVDFTVIKESMDNAETDLSRRLKRTCKQIWMDYIKQIRDSGLIKRFDPARLTELKPRFLKDMNVVLKQSFMDLLEQAHKEAKNELFPEKKFGLDEGELNIDDMMEVLDAEAFNITKDYQGLVSKKVNADIAQGLKQGLSTDDIMAQIKEDMPDLSDRWIDTLVRTKTTEIYNRGRKSYFDNDPMANQIIEAYQYSAIIDNRTSDICLHLDGRVFNADDENINLLTPPQHFNAIREDEKVLTKDGYKPIQDIGVGDEVMTHKGNWKKVYNKMSKINDDFDYVLRIEHALGNIHLTPDHPMLTKEKWAPAGDIRVGDHIAQAKQNFSTTFCSRDSLVSNADHSILQPIQVSESKKKFSFFLPRIISEASANLNQYFTNLKINHPFVYDKLEFVVNSRVMKHLYDLSFSLSGVASVILGYALRHFKSSFLVSSGVASDHGSRASSVVNASFFGFSKTRMNKVGVSNDFSQVKTGSFSLSPVLDSKLPELVGQNVNTRQAKFSSQRADRLSFSEVSLLNHGLEKDGIVNIHVEDYNILTAVKSITKVPYAGMVYNLAVAGDESYVVNGIVVHNCRSVIVPVTKFEKDTLEDVEDVPSREDLQDEGAGFLSTNKKARRYGFDQVALGDKDILRSSYEVFVAGTELVLPPSTPGACIVLLRVIISNLEPEKSLEVGLRDSELGVVSHKSVLPKNGGKADISFAPAGWRLPQGLYFQLGASGKVSIDCEYVLVHDKEPELAA